MQYTSTKTLSKPSLWAFRSVVWEMATREFRTRYAGSALGAVWSLIHPISLILIFTLVFSKVMGARLQVGSEPAPGSYAHAIWSLAHTYGYAIYLCSGLFPWTAFTEAAQRSATAFFDNRNLIQKLRFPVEAPVAWISTFSLLNGLLTLGLLVILVLVTAQRLALSFLLLPVILGLLQVWAFGLGLMLAALTVFFRDLAQIVAILFQLWFWMTPIVYVQSLLGEKSPFLAIQKANPMFHIMQALRAIVMEGAWPAWSDLGILVGMSAISMTLGYAVVGRLRADIPDEI